MRHYTAFVLLLIISVAFSSCNSNQRDTSTEANRAVVRKYHDVKNNGQVAELDKILAADYVFHQIGGRDYKGINPTKEQITLLRTSLPDLTNQILDLVAEGDRVVTRFKMVGTFQVKFMNLEPTGKPVVVEEISVYRLANGQIAEEWNLFDSADLERQIKPKN